MTKIDLRIILHRRKIFFFRPPSSTSPSSAYTAALIKLRFFRETSTICMPSKLKIFCLCLRAPPPLQTSQFCLPCGFKQSQSCPFVMTRVNAFTPRFSRLQFFFSSSLQTTDQNAAGSRTPDNVLILHSKPKFTTRRMPLL